MEQACAYQHGPFFAADDYPEVHHSYDVWHKSKKLKKALAKVNKNILFIVYFMLAIGWETTRNAEDLEMVLKHSKSFLVQLQDMWG